MPQELIKRIRVYGIVQGVGFRPCVVRHAQEAGIRGTVANKGPYVEIYAQGTKRSLGVFLNLLRKDPPERADIIEIRVEDITESATAGGYQDFRIISSGKTTGEIFIPPDIAICDDCKRELFDPSNRRYLHPFINCTQCGPRLTIIDGLPYDRERTSMKHFPMCPACAREYHDPGSRRFDAQPVCCHDCGPEVYLLTADRQGRHDAGRRADSYGQPAAGKSLRGSDSHAAISFARKVIASGGIVAVKGIGGFHLCCDATNAQAVEKLRHRKHRPMKPFAVMMRNEQVVERECIVTCAQRKILTGHQKPILLLEKRRWNNAGKPGTSAQLSMEDESAAQRHEDVSEAAGSQRHEYVFEAAESQRHEDLPEVAASQRQQKEWQNQGEEKECPKLCAAVSPDNPTVGVMLPYAPIQLLLFDYDDGISMPDILVMTSGNVSGAPIARTDEEAISMLSSFCDCILSNNRPILLRCDDSVMDFYEDKPYMIRRSRGYAPLPVQCDLRFDRFDEREDSAAHVLRSAVSMNSSSHSFRFVVDVNHDNPAAAENRKENIFSVLAVGGELKNTFCITRGDLFYPSSYIGDLGDARSVAACKEAVHRMLKLLETRPQCVVCDQHPLYQSTRLAEELAEEYAVPLLRVQHHYAHILSCMTENNITNAVLGIAMDGTGYGEDKTIWGGELMICDPHGYQRVASIQPFLQVGGDAAAREGWRVAVSMIYGLYRNREELFACLSDRRSSEASCFLDTNCHRDAMIIDSNRARNGSAKKNCQPEPMETDSNRARNGSMPKKQAAMAFDFAMEIITSLHLCSPAQARMLFTMYDGKINAIPSTSAGRLFDAAAAILGIRRTSTFEGEASTALMYHALAFEQAVISHTNSHHTSSDIGHASYDTSQADIFEQSHVLLAELHKVPLTRTDSGLLLLPADQLIFILLREKMQELFSDAGTRHTNMLAYVFHAALADMLVRAATEARKNGAPAVCALSGGCFQNKLLLRLTEQGLQKEAFTVLRHHLIPPNDGGIALGQALAGSCYSGAGAAGYSSSLN